MVLSREETTMLLTFRSKAAADVLMLSEHAVPLLRAAGKTMESSPERGVFTVEQLPAAIAGIERAIKEAAPPQEDDDEDDDDRSRHPISEPVSLQRRAYPLLEMMRRARDKGVEVVWEVGSAW